MKLYLYLTKVGTRYRIKGAALFLHSQSVLHKSPGAAFNCYRELQTTEIVVAAVSLHKALRKLAANFFSTIGLFGSFWPNFNGKTQTLHLRHGRSADGKTFIHNHFRLSR